ncbi:carbamoyltransferase HypF [Algoriphagus sp. NBT04N3]|uniref:carbamoyltransferase HypF n=1 Tax=Algoriphagus sp. NBT04N3 TaxID=2705473 RepID=UPI001C6348A5|nr:carbamoyltransferase HypF [Algoriphagus sp. NBT04N3]QYH37893.1 carbamoyltransferase HypF [Algoriphagus sp. NBT04N3]
MQKTFEITISGQVQGVGFRPFVFKLAKEFAVKGTVCNNQDGVLINCNLSAKKAQRFLERILNDAPEISVIQSHSISEISFQEFKDFKIVPSESKQQVNIPLTPDIAICESCREEIRDTTNRRYAYAFTTCTNCGPRFSVTTQFPFERKNTTVDAFKMCVSCQEEYTNPDDRRFHSQTNSCGDCGIKLELQDYDGKQFYGDQRMLIEKASDLIRKGSILALKNTNGYLLCCDANNKTTIQRLREKKQRPAKPFALLYPSLDKIKKDFNLSSIEENAVTSSVAPIVILNPKESIDNLEKESIAPGLDHLGVMLPSSALLTLLMDELDIPIIATSGNMHGSPIISKKIDAIQKLAGLTDYFLHHDLGISFPQDDSVFRFVGEQQLTLRRSRGLAPNYLNARKSDDKILAMGAHLKSTFTFVPNFHTYVSPYFGNLDSYDVLERLQDNLKQFIELFQTPPNVVLVDEHPQYQSSILGRELAETWSAELVSVQHHKAHLASVLGEHGLFASEEKILGVVWDGTGLGEDEMIWGGEFFTYQNRAMERFLYFEYYDWLAADKMAKEPRLSLLSMLPDGEKQIAEKKFSKTEWKVYLKMLENNPLKTSSVGRLFDGVASLLGIIDVTSYEGEAAMLLENQAKKYVGNNEVDFLEGVVFENIPTKTIIQNIHQAMVDGFSIPRLAHSFIHTLALVIFKIAAQHNFSIIACSGGVFQNSILVEKLIKLGGDSKINIKFNRILSSNDENISFGQFSYYQHIKK